MDAVALTVAFLICVAVVYRALSVRRVLASPTYRSRALWTGAVAAFIGFFDLFQITLESLFPASQSGGTFPTGVPLWVAVSYGTLSVVGVLIVFGWLYSTVEVALDLDFRHRDVIGWKRLRKVSWACAIVLAIVSAYITSAFEYLVVGLLIGALFAYSGGALVILSRRVLDMTMRKYMKSMGLAVLAVLVEIALSTYNFYLNFPMAVLAYCLYRAASSLTKTRRVGIEGEASPPVPASA